ncbi:MAG: primosomal protein N' [Cellulomonas sp.]
MDVTGEPLAQGAEVWGEQLTLAGLSTPPPAAGRRSGARPDAAQASERPVATVCIDLPVPHLDRPFEYMVPETMSADAQPGTRVRVRFAGQDVEGYVLDRADRAEHEGRLIPLRRVVSAEAVLTPAVRGLARAVADRYAGTLSDVLRLAIPPRHARVENEPRPAPDSRVSAQGTLTAAAWLPYRGGPAFLSHLTAGGAPRAVLTALPGPAGERWPDAVAQAVAACVVGGRGALVVVPDARDVARVCAALDEVGVPAWAPGSAGGYVRLTADDGPAPRYRAYLAALRGHADVVVGTRAAAFAPVSRLGLVVCWDDGDDLHSEPRSPYPHVREVLMLRSTREQAAFLVAAHGRTVEAQRLVESGWAREVVADRATVRGRTPRVRALTSVELAREGPAAAARLPGEAWRVVREQLGRGPVLVQVPRSGYLPVVACGRCRAIARCGTCHGSLALESAGGVPQCEWCGRLATGWRCGECGFASLRSVRVGSSRTAEELGRAFPGVPVRSSGARAEGGVLATVPDAPALVVATPGAEPVCASGYAAAVLLDAGVASASTSFRAGEEAVRRWLAAAALVRGNDAGGQVLLVGDGAPGPTQALVRWDPAGFAARELAERAELALPPAVRVASLTGTREAVEAVVGRLDLPLGSDVLGPVAVATGAGESFGDAPGTGQAPGTATGRRPSGARGPAQASLDPQVRVLVRSPLAASAELTRTLAASIAVRSARREGGSVRVRVDPEELV